MPFRGAGGGVPAYPLRLGIRAMWPRAYCERNDRRQAHRAHSGAPMTTKELTAIDVLRLHGDEIVRLWQDTLISSGAASDLRNRSGELKGQAEEFLRLVTDVAQGGETDDVQSQSWTPVRSFLKQLSNERARSGYTSSQTATFVF